MRRFGVLDRATPIAHLRIPLAACHRPALRERRGAVSAALARQLRRRHAERVQIVRVPHQLC
jgi:hypothetical protein